MKPAFLFSTLLIGTLILCCCEPTPEWKALVQKSKFKDLPNYGKIKTAPSDYKIIVI
ncbi:MAG: hypothetical protein ACI8X3_000921 [Saprospiraceae bacterium]|jgi:hypothetical protein